MAETKMICPDCGTEMNHHAEKLIEPTTAEEARRILQEARASGEEAADEGATESGIEV